MASGNIPTLARYSMSSYVAIIIIRGVLEVVDMNLKFNYIAVSG